MPKKAVKEFPYIKSEIKDETSLPPVMEFFGRVVTVYMDLTYRARPTGRLKGVLAGYDGDFFYFEDAQFAGDCARLRRIAVHKAQVRELYEGEWH